MAAWMNSCLRCAYYSFCTEKPSVLSFVYLPHTIIRSNCITLNPLHLKFLNTLLISTFSVVKGRRGLDGGHWLQVGEKRFTFNSTTGLCVRRKEMAVPTFSVNTLLWDIVIQMKRKWLKSQYIIIQLMFLMICKPNFTFSQIIGHGEKVGTAFKISGMLALRIISFLMGGIFTYVEGRITHHWYWIMKKLLSLWRWNLTGIIQRRACHLCFLFLYWMSFHSLQIFMLQTVNKFSLRYYALYWSE